MTRWDDASPWFPPSRPRRVEGGIRARSRRGRIGETWWSGRFISVLESFGMGNRLTRGRSYARAGQVLDLSVAAGTVTAQVQGSRAKPYRVRIELGACDDAAWAAAEEALAGQALFRARLLAGEMPPEVEEAFEDCGLALFPRSVRDLAMACSCPDFAVPCKHLAATFYLLAEAFDADPFLVFAWRGRTKEELLDRLRALSGAGSGTSRGEPTGAGRDDGLALDVDDRPLAECLDAFWLPASDPADPVGPRRHRPAAPGVPDLLLRQLDRPDIEVRGHNLADLLTPAYQVMPSVAARDPADHGDEDPS